MMKKRYIKANSGSSDSYLSEMVDSIIDVFDEYEWEYDDRDELAQQMNDDLWDDDAVTGNGSGSYYMNTQKSKERVLSAGMDYLLDAIRDFDISAEEVGKHFLNGDWEYFDVTIRCYLLGQAIGEALDKLGIE